VFIRDLGIVVSVVIWLYSQAKDSENQWRSQKFGLGGAVGQFWLKSLINIEILDIKG